MSEMTAIRDGWFWVPTHQVGPRGTAPIIKKLTYQLPFSAPGDPPIRMYSLSRAGMIGLPRAYGERFFGAMNYEDHTTLGRNITVPRLPDPNHPRVRDPVAQARFMADLRNGLLTYGTLLASADTGTGKTVSFLDASARIGRTTIIFLHLTRLMDQWAEEIHDKLGVPESRIGIIQGKNCDFEGKDYCVAMLHSVVQNARYYPPAFFEAFGTLCVDEVHKIGQRQFAPICPLFPTRYKLGLSATIDETKSATRVFMYHLGEVRVTSSAQALPMKVYVVDYDCGGYPLWGSNPAARGRCLARDKRRTESIAYHILRLYQGGRQPIIVSDSIQHLQELMVAANRLGVPMSAMGQYTGEEHIVTERIVGGKTVRDVRRIKKNKEELAEVKACAQITFATYGMLTEGIDEPRWDAGLDASPRGKATQLIGRVRRPVPGKRDPVWITYRDVRCAISKGLFEGRCKDYSASNAELVYVRAQFNYSPSPGSSQGIHHGALPGASRTAA